MERVLKPFLKKVPSYLKDTKHFLNVIQDYHVLHEDEFLLTIDVGSLYTLIPHDEGLKAVSAALSSMHRPGVSPSTGTKLTSLVLKNNTFKFNDRYFT